MLLVATAFLSVFGLSVMDFIVLSPYRTNHGRVLVFFKIFLMPGKRLVKKMVSSLFDGSGIANRFLNRGIRSVLFKQCLHGNLLIQKKTGLDPAIRREANA